LAIFHIQFLFSKITADVSQRFVPRESKYSRFILPLGLIKPEDHLSKTDEPQRPIRRSITIVMYIIAMASTE